MSRTSIIATAAVLAAGTSLAAPNGYAQSAHDRFYAAHNCGASTNAVIPTSADLIKAFPASFRAANVKKLSQIKWHADITCAKSAKPITHGLRPAQGIRPARNNQQNTTKTAYNWSGYLDSVSAKRSFMAWQVPSNPTPETSSSVTGATYGGDTQVSIWPGLGTGTSSTNDVLIQNGTETKAHCELARNNPPQAGKVQSTYCLQWSSSSYFWWETYDKSRQLPEHPISGHPLADGDQVATASWWFAGKAQFFFLNLTTNHGFDLSTPSAPPGASAEWIVERPTTPVGLAALTKYGTLSPYNMSVDTSGDVNNAKYVPAGTYSGTIFDMVEQLPDPTGSGSHDGASTSEVTSQSGGNMTTVWHKYF